MSDKPTVSTFIRAFRPVWFAAMSGGFSVPFAFAVALVDNKYIQAILLMMAFGGAWFASYQVWKIERQKVRELEYKLKNLVNEYAHSLRIERIDLEEERRLDKSSGALQERRRRFAITFKNSIQRPIGYEIKLLVIDGEEDNDALTKGGVISALSEATFYTKSKELDASDLDSLISAKMGITLAYGHPYLPSRLMNKVVNLSCYPKSRYTRWLYERESDDPINSQGA
jgi:hypothetical protein